MSTQKGIWLVEATQQVPDGAPIKAATAHVDLTLLIGAAVIMLIFVAAICWLVWNNSRKANAK